MKSKFRQLQKLEMYDVPQIPLVISGACVLHNVILRKENLNLEIEHLDLEAIRQHDVGGDDGAPRQAHAVAVQKRDEIAALLARHM